MAINLGFMEQTPFLCENLSGPVAACGVFPLVLP